MLGVPEEMVTEMVATTGVEGAVKRALSPGAAEEMLPALDSQLITAFGGMTPSRLNGMDWFTSSLQSRGWMVTVFVGVATLPQLEMKNNDVVRSNKILRNMLYSLRTCHLHVERKHRTLIAEILCGLQGD